MAENQTSHPGLHSGTPAKELGYQARELYRLAEGLAGEESGDAAALHQLKEGLGGLCRNLSGLSGGLEGLALCPPLPGGENGPLASAMAAWALPLAAFGPNDGAETPPLPQQPLLLWPKTSGENPCRQAIEQAGIRMVEVLPPGATEGFSADVLSAEKALRLYKSEPVIFLCTSLAALPYADAFPSKLLWLALPKDEGPLAGELYTSLLEKAREAAAYETPPGEKDALPGAKEMATLWRQRQKAGAALVVLAAADYHAPPGRSHHLARLAAQRGRQVVWVNASAGEQTRLLSRCGNLLAFELAAGEGEGRLDGDGVQSAHTPDRQRQLRAQLGLLLDALQLQRALLVVGHPFWGEAAFSLRREKRLPVLFDYHDDYAARAGNYAPQLLRAEKGLLGGADYVVAASAALAQRAGIGKARMATVRNGCDFAHFSAAEAPEKQPGAPVVLGYYGPVSPLLSLEVLRALDNSGLELEIHLVGKASEETRTKLSALHKVRLRDEVPYEELPGVLAGFDLALLPYSPKHPSVEIASPGKFYEYLAAGKPVVGTAIPELMVFRGRYACLENDPSWFVRRVRECLDGISQLVSAEERVQFAQQNSWQNRANELESIYQKLEVVRGRTIRGDIWAERAAHGKQNAPERPMLALPPPPKKKKGEEVPRVQLAAAMASLQDAEEALQQKNESFQRALELLESAAPASASGVLRSLGRGKQNGPSTLDEAKALLEEGLALGQQRASTALLRAPGAGLPALPAVYTKYDLLFFPAEAPGQWQSRSAHLALQYAENGHRVFYFSPAFSGLPAVSLQQENLYVVELPGQAGATLFEEGLAEDSGWQEILNSLLWHFGIREGLSVVSYPRWLPAALHLKEHFSLPLVADCHSDFTGFLVPGSNESEDCGLKLLQQADLAIPTSEAVATVVRQVRGGELPKLVENGCDYARFHEVFSPSTPCPLPQAGPDGTIPEGQKRPVLGFCGLVSHWFSAQMVIEAAKALPEADFVLAGPVLEWESELRVPPNIRLVGETPAEEIPALVQSFDLALLPFDPESDISNTLCPSAFFEYLAAGKKVVATKLPALAPYTGKQALLAETPAEFTAHIRAALAGEDGLCGAEEAAALAEEADWKKRWAAFSALAEEVFSSVSIVLCTHNALEHLKACISTVLGLTALPQYELIVADCGSTDGTSALLEELAQEDLPHLRVVQLEAGKSPAAGWNAGIREATGDYLVLLQDCSLITRGWLPALLAPLKQDESLGLCGPATNLGGGEAKVPVYYHSAEEMAQFAYFYTWQHLGETRTKGASLSLFCAALRRATMSDLGPLDEGYQTTCLPGADLCRTLQKAGKGLAVAEGAFVHRACLPQEACGEAAETLLENDKKHFEEKWDSVWKPAPHRSGVTREMNADSLFPLAEDDDK